MDLDIGTPEQECRIIAVWGALMWIVTPIVVTAVVVTLCWGGACAR